MVCASTCCRGVYIEVLSARLQESLKISVEKGSIQPWLGGDQPHNCQSDHSLNLPHAMPTLPHCHTGQPHPHPTHHHIQTGQGNQATYIYIGFLPSTSSFMFILPVPSPVLVRPTCRLLWCPEARAFWQIYLYHLFGNFRQFILYFPLLFGRFSHLTLLWLYAFIQKRHCLCLKTPGTVWLSNNCQYW